MSKELTENQKRRVLYYFKEIKAYCEEYQEWPKNYNYPKTKEEKESARLYIWLNNSRYFRGEFKYINVQTEDGRNIKEELDILRDKYNSKKKKVFSMLESLKTYCEVYQDWPKKYANPKTDKEFLSNRLYSWLSKTGYLKGKFKYSKVLTKEGLNVEEELNNLKEKYLKKAGDIWINHVRNIFEEIKKYCETYHEFPRNLNSNESEQAIISTRLYKFLHHKGYFKNNFKYSDVLTEDGKNIKEELDKLYLKYGRTKMDSPEYVLKRFKEVKAYCEAYQEWPRQHEKHKTEKEKESAKLYNWIVESGYLREQFKYSNVQTDEGLNVKEELDKLYLKYGNVLKNKFVLQVIQDIKAYCEEYQEWPRMIGKAKTLKERKSRRLYFWLRRNGYYKGDFKYSNVLTEDGRSVKEVLDKLYATYIVFSRTSKEYVLERFKKIKAYCEVYQEWPRHHGSPETEKEHESAKLYSWLNNNGYLRGEFKYSNVQTEEGLNLKEELDELYAKYSRTKKSSIEYILERFKEIKKYCETYQEWPKKHVNPKIEKEHESAKLYSWLNNNGYLRGEFKYSNVQTEEGLNLKEELDELYAKYSRTKKNSIEYILERFQEIKAYCEKYQEWPKQYIKPTTEKEKESSKLYSWLSKTGYLKREFKYSKVLTKEGLTIEEELDRLYAIYGVLSRTSKEYMLERFQEIKTYCEIYQEWPKQYIKPTTEKEKESKKLYKWLSSAGYFKDNFKYINILNEDGRNIKEELDKLRETYRVFPRSIRENPLRKFERIKMYCEAYQEWPKQYIKPATEKEKESSKLYSWLSKTGYLKREFKYSKVLTKEGLTIEEELDRLYAIYGVLSRTSKEYMLERFQEIKTYCEIYQEWPRQYKNPTTEKEKQSTKLYSWLNGSRYLKGEFKYSNVQTEDGKNIKEELDILHDKYNSKIKKVFIMLKSLKEYCEVYQEWPRHHVKPMTEKEKKSAKLYNWLNNSGYLKGEFKYIDLKVNGLSIKMILDYYYFKYAIKDIWSIKDSYDLITKTYYYIINIWRELENNNEVMVKYYYEALLNLLGSIFISLNLEEVMDILNQDIDNISSYFLYKYQVYSIAGDTWAYLYKSLYEYSLCKKQQNTLKL